MSGKPLIEADVRLRQEASQLGSMYQRKPPEELHLGERLQGGFLPLTGRIPPDSGGWHRGLFSGSVAGREYFRVLDTLPGYDMRREFGNSTGVRVAPPLILWFMTHAIADAVS